MAQHQIHHDKISILISCLMNDWSVAVTYSSSPPALWNSAVKPQRYNWMHIPLHHPSDSAVFNKSVLVFPRHAIIVNQTIFATPVMLTCWSDTFPLQILLSSLSQQHSLVQVQCPQAPCSWWWGNTRGGCWSRRKIELDDGRKRQHGEGREKRERER